MSGRICRAAGAALGLIALSQPYAAYGQACVPQADLSAGIVYAMPLIVQAVEGRCSATLPADGYLALQGDELKEKFAAHQDTAWPGALRLLGQFAGSDDPSFGQLMQTLPEDALRPFVDAILVEKIGAEIKPKDCSRIERGMQLLEPLPPTETAELIAFLASMTKSKDIAICPTGSE